MIGSSDGKQYETPLGVALGRPVEAPEKPADASKSSPGTQVAPDYDYDAAKAAGVKQDERGHWPDTYKLPNHITFSDESIHNKGGAGHWEDLGEDKWSFTPGSENLKHHSMDDMREYFKKYEPNSTLIEPKQDAPIHIDRSHDVPLAASALHKDGEFYGVAIDKDAPIRPEYDQYIHKHESDEFHYMKDLMTNGMDSKEAYHKAHDHITPMESARVQADLGEKGLEDYKQYWRDVASISSSKDNPNRHPDAHTTTFGLDEAELGKKFAQNDPARQKLEDKQWEEEGWENNWDHAVPYGGAGGNNQSMQDAIKKYPGMEWINTHGGDRGGTLYFRAKKPEPLVGSAKPLQREALFRGLKGAGITATDAAFEPLNPMSPHYQNPGGHAREGIGTWYRGAEGKWRQEIPDAGSKIKPAIKDLNLPFSERVKKPILKLEDIIHHPELFKSYPDLKDIKVSPVPPVHLAMGVKGAVSKEGDVLYLRSGMSDSENKSVLLHEIQHLIQTKEGFVKGSNTADMESVVKKAIQNTGIPGKGMEQAAAFKAYQHVSGEVEARNVQRRIDWPLEALDIFPPTLTEDISRRKQLNPPK